jgi:hypothetical protein
LKKTRSRHVFMDEYGMMNVLLDGHIFGERGPMCIPFSFFLVLSVLRVTIDICETKHTYRYISKITC